MSQRKPLREEVVKEVLIFTYIALTSPEPWRGTSISDSALMMWMELFFCCRFPRLRAVCPGIPGAKIHDPPRQHCWQACGDGNTNAGVDDQEPEVKLSF